MTRLALGLIVLCAVRTPERTPEPYAGLRVLDVGLESLTTTAPYRAAHAQVTGLAASADGVAAALAERPQFHQVTRYDPAASIAEAGIGSKTMDLVFATLPRGAPTAGLEAVLDVHGLLVVTHPDGSRAFIRMPGVEDPRARRLELDRTACVDRARIYALADTPMVGAPPLGGTTQDSKTELFVFAHPDDESVYAGGTMRGLVDQGKRVVLVVATDGGAGRSESGEVVARNDELANAARVLGVTRTESLHLPDTGKYVDDRRRVPLTAAGALERWGRDVVVEKLVRIIRTERPEIIWGFDASRDPDYALHGHHLAMGEVTALAFRLAADPHAFSEQGLAPWAAREQRAVAPFSANVQERITIPVDMPRKLEAVRAHASQLYSTDCWRARVDAKAESTQVEVWSVVQKR